VHSCLPVTVSPFILRFDAGSVPVGYLVFSSPTRTVGEIQDVALNRVRPLFAHSGREFRRRLPLAAPLERNCRERSTRIACAPNRMAPDEVIQALNTGNAIVPAGNVRTGDLLRLAPINSVVSNIKDLQNLPIRREQARPFFCATSVRSRTRAISSPDTRK